jgi:hypothetical protein
MITHCQLIHSFSKQFAIYGQPTGKHILCYIQGHSGAVALLEYVIMYA